MTGNQRPQPPPKAPAKRSRPQRELDPNDPLDMAFEMVSSHVCYFCGFFYHDLTSYATSRLIPRMQIIKGEGTIGISDALRYTGLDRRDRDNNYQRVWQRVNTYKKKKKEQAKQEEEDTRVAAECLSSLSTSIAPPPLPPPKLGSGKKRKAAPTITPGTSA